MPDPILEYETPPEPVTVVPQPVGRRALVAACVFAGVGAACIAISFSDVGRAIGGAPTLLGIGCVGAALASVATLGEALFFPRNVSDRPRAIAASALNLVVALLLVATWLGLFLP